jgi:hypoxia up-regulated 1
VERSTLKDFVNAVHDWMYEKEAQSATATILKAKLKEMKDIVTPVQNRQREASLRPKAVALLEKSLGETTMFLNLIKSATEEAEKARSSANEEASKPTTSAAAGSNADPLADLEEEFPSVSQEASPGATPKIADVFNQYTPEDLSEVQKFYDEAKAFLEERVKKQAKLAPTENPAFDASELDAKAQSLNDAVIRIMERRMTKFNGSGGGGSKSSSTKKEKTKTASKKGKKKNLSTTKEGETVTVEVPEDSGSGKEKAKTSTKDEL